jgi:hypothetical protein
LVFPRRYRIRSKATTFAAILPEHILDVAVQEVTFRHTMAEFSPVVVRS